MLKMWSKKTKEQEALDALAHYQQDQTRNAAYQSQAIQAQNNMAGGGSGLAIGVANANLGTWGQNAYASGSTGKYVSNYSDKEKALIEAQAMERERRGIVKLIQEMAEEVGAPNLLNAIVLAISSRDYPTEG